jgi:hypothetical protein
LKGRNIWETNASGSLQEEKGVGDCSGLFGAVKTAVFYQNK